MEFDLEVEKLKEQALQKGSINEDDIYLKLMKYEATAETIEKIMQDLRKAGVEIKKDQFMSILDKTIIDCKENKVDALYRLLDDMIDEDSYLLTLLIGEGVTDKEEEQIRKHIEDKYPDIETEIRRGEQPVYFFLLGVE